MKAKLINTNVNYLLEDDKGVIIASTSTKEGNNKLSKQNCDEIFGVVDAIDVVYKQVRNGFDGVIDSFTEAFGKQCINKAMELNKDKLFTLEDMKKAIVWAHDKSTEGVYLSRLPVDEFIQSLQQPTEIEVEIEMEDIRLPHGANESYIKSIPKLDSEGCLILKKK
jgi:hypothetical protein